MAKTILLLGYALFAFFVKDSHGRDVTNWEEKLAVEGIDDFGAINDLCNCSNGACICCLEMPNFNACSTIRIVEDNNRKGNTTYGIKLTISINNRNVASHSVRVSDIPPLCYETDGMGVCTKLSVRREMKNFKLCGSIQLKVNKKVIHEQEMYCIDIPSRTFPANNERIDDISFNDSSSLGSLVGSLLRTWTLARADDSIQENHNSLRNDKTRISADSMARINPLHIINLILDNKLGRIDRNTNPDKKHWEDWDL